ncbi:hypothetical protein LCGC14_0278610 [marine sediment metagenome]|uniref:Uncharacterized protein n=1 Tax=marine sediment metagenome TaxID=412755 RepID=A0A0F9X263_9ZZZZ
MAKINFSVVLTKLEGGPLKDDKNEDLTLASAAKQALLVLDEKQTGEKKYEHYCLATKVAGGGEVTLKSEEITMIKEVIGKYMYPIVVGQAWDLLEGKASAQKK